MELLFSKKWNNITVLQTLIWGYKINGGSHELLYVT